MIDTALVQKLIKQQFPQWQSLSIKPVAKSGWDNNTFHLGEHMLVRMPSAECYANQVTKEYYWLPRLAPYLPLSIPKPLALAKTDPNYPWPWAIYSWLEGDSLAADSITNLSNLAIALAKFLIALHQIKVDGGPIAGEHNFFRGGSLRHYDAETQYAIKHLDNKINSNKATQLWQQALKTEWQNPPVWVHGDISAGNLLLRKGQLSAVIDFGQLAVGDPACDCAFAWTFFKEPQRGIFLNTLGLDSATYARARGWALWKSLIVAAGLTQPNNLEAALCWDTIHEILQESI